MAEIKYLVDLDLSKNQLLQAVVQNLGTAPTTPLEGQIYWDTLSNTLMGYNGTAWVDMGSDSITNLSTTTTTTTATVVSSDGTDALIPNAVAGGQAGVMSGADKTKVDGAFQASNVIDEDSFATDSDTKVPTQQSVKAYVAAQLVSEMSYKGGYSAITNDPDLDIAGGTTIAISKGDTYTITGIPSTFYGEAVEAGDIIIAEIADAAAAADWTIVNRNIPTIVSATESATGVIELATQAEVDAGVDTIRAVTPATLSGFSSGSQKTVIPNTLGTTTTFIDAEYGHYEVYRVAGGAKVEAQITYTGTTTTVIFNTSQTAGAYDIVKIS